MKRRILPYAQAGLEGARWLRSEAEIGGTFTSHIQKGSFREAGLHAVRGGLRLLPAFDVKKPLGQLVRKDYEVVGVGSEVIAVRTSEGDIHKYVTGKTQKPETLAPRLKELYDKAKPILGEYLLDTNVTIEKTKLFKGATAREFVRLDQPFIDVKLVDPHRDLEMLKDSPRITEALRDFSHRLTELFETEGLLMDIVNRGNLVWGSVGGAEDQLYLLDTIPVDYHETDFTGIAVPFWGPDMHLEYLADFVNTTHDTDYFTDDLDRERVA